MKRRARGLKRIRTRLGRPEAIEKRLAATRRDAVGRLGGVASVEHT
jgi:hypothetical protein